ncbi:MAG: hypothetical protein CL480_09075 [Acidobacteria bacterium]|nr:hypothetical protein [Acidobacteriota bacterium]
MFVRAFLTVGLAYIMLAGATVGYAQEPVVPVREFGQTVIGAFEGWYRNADGSFTLLVGYFNRNSQEHLEIPIGPNNQILPGAPDRGQPTHFSPRRQWGVFTIVVPPDFGDQSLTWTLTTNGQSTSIPLLLDPLWAIEPFENVAMGNSPPTVRFEEDGVAFQGPPREVAASFETSVTEPVMLSLWVTDDLYVRPGQRQSTRPPLGVGWSVFRGQGKVTFDEAEPEVPETGGLVTATATFDTPGQYLLRAEITDNTGKGGGGSQCCWTTAHVAVTVHP